MIFTHDRLLFHLPLLLLALFSILLIDLLTYWGAANQVERWQLQRMAAQMESLEHSLKPYLFGSVSLDQFTAFNELVTDLQRSDGAIRQFALTDALGTPLFTMANATDAAASGSFQELTPPAPLEVGRWFKSESRYRLEWPLSDRFATIGALVLEVDHQSEQEALGAVRYGILFDTLLMAAFLGLAILILSAVIDAYPEQELRYQKLMNGGYIASLVAVVGLSSLSVAPLYQQELRIQGEMVVTVVAGRINGFLQLGAELTDLTGVNALLQHYQTTHDLGTLAVAEQGVVHWSSDIARLGQSLPAVVEGELALTRSLGAAAPTRTAATPAAAELTLLLPLEDRVWETILSRSYLFLFLISFCGVLSWWMIVRSYLE